MELSQEEFKCGMPSHLLSLEESQNILFSSSKVLIKDLHQVAILEDIYEFVQYTKGIQVIKMVLD